MRRIVISGGLPSGPAIDTSSSTMAPNPPRPRPTDDRLAELRLALLANTLAANVPAPSHRSSSAGRRRLPGSSPSAGALRTPARNPAARPSGRAPETSRGPVRPRRGLARHRPSMYPTAARDRARRNPHDDVDPRGQTPPPGRGPGHVDGSASSPRRYAAGGFDRPVSARRRRSRARLRRAWWSGGTSPVPRRSRMTRWRSGGTTRPPDGTAQRLARARPTGAPWRRGRRWRSPARA